MFPRNPLSIFSSKQKVVVTTEISSMESTIQELISKAQKANRSIIFTVTPGPFISMDELPPNWMNTNDAKGCSKQLEWFQKSFNELNADVYAINKQNSDYQCTLIQAKKLPNLHMLSDADGELQKSLQLDTITVDNNTYLKRITFVMNSNGQQEVFQLQSPVSDDLAKQHLENISQFISQNRNEFQKKT